MPTPALLAISHGTASPAGQAAVAALVEAVAAALPDVHVRLGHVDVQQPDVAASLDALPADEPVVIVPLLLSAGYHVRVDLREQSAGARGVAISPALGPDPRLVDVLVARLADARSRPGRRRRARRRRLERRSRERGLPRDGADAGRATRSATCRSASSRPPSRGSAPAVRAAREGGRRVVVANYLLAPGYFHDLAVRLADGSAVARPLLDDDEPAAAPRRARRRSVPVLCRGGRRVNSVTPCDAALTALDVPFHGMPRRP